MKSINTITILIVVIGLTQACKSLKVEKGSNNSFNTQLTVFQNGSEIRISKPSELIEIERSEFALRFYNKKYDSENKKFHAAQIAAFINKSEFDKIKTGLTETELRCFEPGSGMASDSSGKYESLAFNSRGHHYVFYENSESKKLNLLKDANGLLKLEFEINALYYGGKEVKMTETELKEFYLAFLVDKNLNGTIDDGELNKLTIKIK